MDTNAEIWKKFILVETTDVFTGPTGGEFRRNIFDDGDSVENAYRQEDDADEEQYKQDIEDEKRDDQILKWYEQLLDEKSVKVYCTGFKYVKDVTWPVYVKMRSGKVMRVMKSGYMIDVLSQRIDEFGLLINCSECYIFTETKPTEFINNMIKKNYIGKWVRFYKYYPDSTPRCRVVWENAWIVGDKPPAYEPEKKYPTFKEYNPKEYRPSNYFDPTEMPPEEKRDPVQALLDI